MQKVVIKRNQMSINIKETCLKWKILKHKIWVQRRRRNLNNNTKVQMMKETYLVCNNKDSKDHKCKTKVTRVILKHIQVRNWIQVKLDSKHQTRNLLEVTLRHPIITMEREKEVKKADRIEVDSIMWWVIMREETLLVWTMEADRVIIDHRPTSTMWVEVESILKTDSDKVQSRVEGIDQMEMMMMIHILLDLNPTTQW
jgi:hypothetical protein